MIMKTLEERVQRLEDVLEIGNLMARYLDSADGGWDRISHDPAKVIPLVTDDFTWEGPFGDYEGPEGAARLWRECRTNYPFAFHVITNPLIEVEGDTAYGEWHVTWSATGPDGTELWSAGVYHNRFERTVEGWRIKSVSCPMVYAGPYSKGWAASMVRDDTVAGQLRDVYGAADPERPF